MNEVTKYYKSEFAREQLKTAVALFLNNIGNMLAGKDQKLINTFLTWVRTNLDPKVYNIHYDPHWNAK